MEKDIGFDARFGYGLELFLCVVAYLGCILHICHCLSFLSLGSSAYSALVALNTTAVGLLYERDGYSAISYRPIDLKDAQVAHDEQQ